MGPRRIENLSRVNVPEVTVSRQNFAINNAGVDLRQDRYNLEARAVKE